MVAILTSVNVFIFLKLKGASEQMLQMAFPGAKDMNEAMKKMQQMTQGMGGMNRGGRGPGMPAGGGNDAQLKAAMQMLQQIQQKGNKR